MENFDESNMLPGILGINYAKIVDCPNYSAIVKETARTLIQNPYLHLGDWFKNLSTSDVTVLNIMAETANNDQQSLEELLLLAEMLARGEGTESCSVEGSRDNLNQFMILVTIEALGRKGLVDVFHENMSLGEDMADKMVVRLKQ